MPFMIGEGGVPFSCCPAAQRVPPSQGEQREGRTHAACARTHARVEGGKEEEEASFFVPRPAARARECQSGPKRSRG